MLVVVVRCGFMEIRRARADDVGDITRLYLLSSQHHVELDLAFYQVPDLEVITSHYSELIGQGGQYACFVAVVDGQTVGTSEVKLSPLPPPHSMLRPRVTAVAGIVVALENRRQGVGSVLMRRAEEWAREQGAEVVMLDMLLANAGAVSFYEHLGYEHHGGLFRKQLVNTR